jgi:hypothetical protein
VAGIKSSWLTRFGTRGLPGFPNIRLLPHELLFGLYLLVTWIRVMIAVGVFHRAALIFAAMLLINAVGIAWCAAREAPIYWRLRLAFYPLLINAAYVAMRVAVPAIHPGWNDALLVRLDRLLIGGNLSVALQSFAHPVLSDILSLCYLFFFPYLFCRIVMYLRGDLEEAKRFFIGLFSVYAIGYLGYTLLPALGPHIYLSEQFYARVWNGSWSQWNAELVLHGSNRVDAFPSIHCAATAFVLFFDRRHHPAWFRGALIPCAGLWLATLYLGYHYFVDVVSGFLLSAFALRLANTYPRPRHSGGLPQTVAGTPLSGGRQEAMGTAG